MKYEDIAEGRHFYDFVFYETEAKTMYIFCPNCGCEYEVKITKDHGIKWIKENYKPCSCFKYTGRQPKYKQTQYEHAELDNRIAVAEFENRNGEAVLVAYIHTASFAASNYYCARPFRRSPEFDLEKTIEMHFKNDGTVTFDTCLYVPMCNTCIKVGGWQRAKKWRCSTFVFDIIEDSIKELKGTNIEQFVPEIDRFIETVSSRINVNIAMNEICAAWLVLMHTSPSAKKLWKAGYRRIVCDRTIAKMIPANYNTYYYYGYYTPESTAGIINWRATTLEKIIKVEPSKFDLICERPNASVGELRGTQEIVKLEKQNVVCSLQNVQIALANKFNDLMKIFAETKFSVSKMFKYIRHNANKVGDGALHNTTNDYYDYLETLTKLGIPLTSDVVFPSDLKKQHDNKAKTLRELTFEDKDKIFIKKMAAYCALSYVDEKYKIEVVKTATQLKNEATKMHNCSAGYVDRIIGGTSVIFVIRQKQHPRKSFYMLELNPKSLSIVQNRGIGNSSQTDELKQFAETWLNQVVKPKAKAMRLSVAA